MNGGFYLTITHDLLKLIIADQREEHTLPTHYIQRTVESKLEALSLNKEIIVTTGLRRTGKSVLLHQIRTKASQSDYYFNFEDERLVAFTVNDFQTLQETFIELFGVQKIYYFDEIQNIVGWEMFVRRLYNSGNKIYITGSNANLFSEELGTRLTGRYIPVSIYPISFLEYVSYMNSSLLDDKLFPTSKVGLLKQLFANYCATGGIPEYIKYQNIEYLHSLYESIIYRDIVARYKLPNALLIKQLVFFLASNCSKEITYNSLRKMLGMGSASTISDYCHYLENSYLCFFVNRYSDSVGAQLQSPKKIYFIDPIIAKTVGFKISEDFGRVLENMVFLELKRHGFEIFYHRELKECDFIIRKSPKTLRAIQVSKDISEIKTRQREIDGLIEALKRFSLTEGLIITENQEFIENVEKEGQIFKINVVPIWKWLLTHTL